MARQRQSIGRYSQEDGAEPVHARLRSCLEVVRHHEKNPHALAEPVTKLPCYGFGPLQLFPAGHELRAIEPRPAVILSVGQLDVLRAHALRHGENLGDMIDVETVQNDVEHHRVVVLLDQRRDFRFQLERARAAEKIVHRTRAVLERKLDVIQTRGLEGGDACFRQPDSGSNQIDIEAKRVRLGHDRLEVVAR